MNYYDEIKNKLLDNKYIIKYCSDPRIISRHFLIE